MPYTRRTFRRRRRAPYTRRPRRGYGALATRPRMMPRSYAFKRHNQVATKVFWFKINGQLSTPPVVENAYYAFRTTGLTLNPPAQLQNVFGLYDQYKVLGISLRWFPVNVGTEPGQTFEQSILNRGDMIVWSDQRFEPNAVEPVNISEVINNASARMIDPRRRYTRSLYRPRGEPIWGSCQQPGNDPDPWDGAIQMLVNRATPSRPLWYYTMTYKVLVRGRRQN